MEPKIDNNPLSLVVVHEHGLVYTVDQGVVSSRSSSSPACPNGDCSSERLLIPESIVQNPRQQPLIRESGIRTKSPVYLNDPALDAMEARCKQRRLEEGVGSSKNTKAHTKVTLKVQVQISFKCSFYNILVSLIRSLHLPTSPLAVGFCEGCLFF